MGAKRPDWRLDNVTRRRCSIPVRAYLQARSLLRSREPQRKGVVSCVLPTALSRGPGRASSKCKRKNRASPDFVYSIGSGTLQTPCAASQASSDGLAASTYLVVTQQAAHCRIAVTGTVSQSAFRLHDSPPSPFQSRISDLILRSCMVASPPHYDGLGGWASIRKGMYTSTRSRR